MPANNLTQLLDTLQINTPTNLQLIDDYLKEIDNQISVTNAILYALQAIHQDSSLTEQTLPMLLICTPDQLITLNQTISLLKFANKYLCKDLVYQLISCTTQCGHKIYQITSSLIGCFSYASMQDLTALYKPEIIANLAKLMAENPNISYEEQMIIIKHPYLVSNANFDAIIPLFNILKEFDSPTTYSALLTVKSLAMSGNLSLNAVDSVFKHGNKMSVRAKVYSLCHRNNLDHIGSLLASQKNINNNHFKVLSILENERLLDSNILLEWHRINPSNGYALKQYDILVVLAKYQRLDANIVAIILKLNLKQLKNLTINDWSKLLELSANDLTITWPNRKLFSLNPMENFYLEDLLVLNYLFTMANQYSVAINKELLDRFECKLSNDSLLVNRLALIDLVSTIRCLHKNNLLTNSVFTNILYKQIPLYACSMGTYLHGIAQTLLTPQVLDNVTIEQVNLLFKLNDIGNTPFSELLAIFVPELADTNNPLRENIDIIEHTIYSDIGSKKYTGNKIKILAEIIKLYIFLKQSNNFTIDLFLKIINVGLKSTTNVYAKFNELHPIVISIFSAKNSMEANTKLIALLDSANITYLTSLNSTLCNLKLHPNALNKLYCSNFFIDELIKNKDLHAFLCILDILANHLKLLCAKNLQALSNMCITDYLINILSLIKENNALEQDTFVFALEYSEMFVDESDSVLEEVNHIQGNQMNYHNWLDLIDICKSDKTTHERKLAIKHYLGNNILAHDPRFNTPQSTHTASVHLSTDITFWLLKCKYTEVNYAQLEQQLYNDITKYTESKRFKEELGDEKWNIEKGIDGLNSILYALTISNIEVPVERKQKALTLMGKIRLFVENSEIQALEETLRNDLSTDTVESIPRFILLIYLEIMHNKPDPKNEYVVLEAFLKCCYETERGYNLDSRGADRNKRFKDRDICAGGVANKFCEILSEQSNLILFYFVAPESIARKIQAELLQHTRRTYTQLRTSDPIAARVDFASLANSDEAADVLTKTWIANKPAIYVTIHEEFAGFLEAETLDADIKKFENDALPYIPSPTHCSARRFYSADFIDWFNSTNISLEAARQGIRSFGEFKENDTDSQDIAEQDLQPKVKRLRNE